MTIKRIFSTTLWTCLSVGLIFLLSTTNVAAQKTKSSNTADCEQIQQWVFAKNITDTKFERTSFLQGGLLKDWYRLSVCQPIWYNNASTFAKTEKLLSVLRYNPKVDGERYQMVLMESLYTEIQSFYLPVGLFDFGELTEFDVLLSDAALQYAVDLAQTSVEVNPTLKKQLANDFFQAVFQDSITTFYQDLTEGKWQAKVEAAAIAEAEKEAITETTTPEKNTPIVTEEASSEVVKEDNTPTIEDSRLHRYLYTVLGMDSTLAQEPLHEVVTLTQFYQNRDYVPVWLKNGQVTSDASYLLRQLAETYKDGLGNKAYHAAKLNDLYQEVNLQAEVNTYGTKEAYEFELLLTDATLHYMNHLQNGVIDFANLRQKWDVADDELNVAMLLQIYINDGQIRNLAAQVRPRNKVYGYLGKALQKYEQLLQNKGEFPLVTRGEGALKYGMTDDRVSELRDRLSYFEALPQTPNGLVLDTLIGRKSVVKDTLSKNSLPATALEADSIINLENDLVVLIDSLNYTLVEKQGFNPAIFDSTVYKAVIDFQWDTGLEADGIVGSGTFKELNTTLSQRIDQIKMNMERWRWLPQSLGSRYVLVNIPAYWLYVYEPNEVIGLEKKVMVGKTYHKTPVFNDLMQYIEFNPYWTVPYSIASREILPKLKRNPGYLAAKDMRLFQGSKSVNPYNVDWSSVYRSNFKYKIRQNPGPKNALGTMKFMFPNLYNVYVHDTPSKSLFVESQRAYSHGCVRLEKPIEFAEYLLKDNKNYTLNKIEKVLDKGKNKRVNLEEALPIYILYFTVWADEEGNPRFMHDIYGKDAEVLQMLGGM